MNTPDAITESAALRMLNMPESRRQELRNTLPSVPVGNAYLYQRSAVEKLRDSNEQLKNRAIPNGGLHTR
jgi:uncharacterized membrane protein YccC